MAEMLALEYLFRESDKLFKEEGSDVLHLFGSREVASQMHDGLRRIIWVPGDESGALGDLSGPDKNSRTEARAVFNLEELFTVYIHANAPLDGDDELAQYAAVRFLYDAWARAMYLVGRGRFKIKRQRYENASKERRFGSTIVVTVAVQAVIPDSPYGATSSAELAITGGVVPPTSHSPTPGALTAAVTAGLDHPELEAPHPNPHSETHTIPATAEVDP